MTHPEPLSEPMSADAFSRLLDQHCVHWGQWVNRYYFNKKRAQVLIGERDRAITAELVEGLRNIIISVESNQSGRAGNLARSLIAKYNIGSEG
jgi:hypothetical protein